MGKFNRKISVKRKIREGFGAGHGSDYKPFITIRDFSSQATVSRVKGWKTQRPHHLLSPQERKYFYVLEWSEPVKDIREQFPLPLEETLEIANRLKIEHPPANYKECARQEFMIPKLEKIG